MSTGETKLPSPLNTRFKTERLILGPLTIAHATFIRELVNSPGWLRFIGERNVKNDQDAKAYIRRINKEPAVRYWVVTIAEQQVPVGIITFIRRSYLDFPDLGFAFLPEFAGKGYAFEAASAVLKYLIKTKKSECLLATTLPENDKSIRLLSQLGFIFDRVLRGEGQGLHLYKFSG